MKGNAMRMLMVALGCLLLAACGGGAGRRIEMAVYDLEVPIASAAPVAVSLLDRVEVRAPSWLAATSMQYRLAVEPGRRHGFADSRWAGPPAELLEGVLKRRLLAAAGQCRLRLDLEEFVQVFDASGDSRARLALGASLLSARGESKLLVRRFELELPAGRNAAAGAAAFAELNEGLASAIAQWLAEAGRSPAGPAIACLR